MSNRIFVTGATGTIGREVVRALTAKGVRPVVATRDRDKAAGLFGEDADIVTFSFDDKATWEQALTNVDAVFVLGPPLVTNLDELLTPFIKYLKSRSVNRLVYFSAMGVEEMSESMPFHSVLEELVKEEGFHYTILRPTFFGSNFRNYEYENIMERNILYSPAGEGRAAFVDPRDVGEVAAEVLLDQEGNSGKVYELTGPESLSYFEAAEILGKVLGKHITYTNPEPGEYAQTLSEAGAPPFVAAYMNKVYALLRENRVDRVSSSVKKITGKEPRSLRETIEYTFRS